MAETLSDREVKVLKPPPKRRRILDPSAIVPVPVYSSKVNNSLQLSSVPAFTETGNAGDTADHSLWSQMSLPLQKKGCAVSLSDSEEEEVELEQKNLLKGQMELCPSPPPPESPVCKQSRHARQKISEIGRKLQVVNAVMSPEPRDQRTRRRRRCRGSSSLMSDEDDDVIVLDTSPQVSSERVIPLKVRCRADIHKIPVLPSTALKDVLAQLSVILNVPASLLLLLREDTELPTSPSVRELGLGIADILECVVMSVEERRAETCGDVITLRLQSTNRDSSQEFSLNRNSELGSTFSRYLSDWSPRSRRKAQFHFDGTKLSPGQTPAQLDMEDGDIVEVWT